jgi:hypothetical protein
MCLALGFLGVIFALGVKKRITALIRQTGAGEGKCAG